MIAVLAFLVALTYVLNLHEESRRTRAKGTSVAVMGAAVSLMDYTGMASVRFMPSVVPQRVSHLVPTDMLVFTAVLCYPGRCSHIHAA